MSDSTVTKLGAVLFERQRPVFGPGGWIGLALVVGIVLVIGGVVPTGDWTIDGLASRLMPLGFGIGVFGIVAAEICRRFASWDDLAEIHAQSFSGIGMMGAGLVVGAVAIAHWTMHPAWVGAVALAALASAQLIASTRRVILQGREASVQVVASERDAHLAELLALQQRLEPELLLNAISAITARAESAPRDAERAVEGLATYLRRSLHAPEVLDTTLEEDMQRAGEYADIMALAGVRVPIAWHVDGDVLQTKIPSGTVRTFLDYALTRCMRDVASEPGITVRSYKRAGRFFLVVTDTAAPDPPALTEPDALMALRRRLGAPPQRRVRLETHVMLEVDGTAAGTTQSLMMRLEGWV